jgi:nitrite reductase/ring-hydroxylating ferredoxin subunit
MASGLLHYFNFGASAKESTTSERESPVRALPASWYTSPAMYEIERRAIFSRRWLFITHTSRVKDTGDWLRYNVAGYDFIITKDRQGNVNAFHNVCRHRAYPVIEKEGFGNAKILACRYHGWSYGLNGKLAKAPGYQDLEFDKDQNGLFPIHTRVDRNGFIWVNMDANETPEVPFEEHFENVDVQQRYVESGINFDDYELDHTYELEGEDFLFNIMSCTPTDFTCQDTTTGKSSPTTSTNATTAQPPTLTSLHSSTSKASTATSKTGTSSTTARRPKNKSKPA